MRRGTAIVVSGTLLILAGWVYLDAKRVSPGEVLPLVDSIDRSAEVLESAGDGEVMVEVLRRRAGQLGVARLALRGGWSGDAKRMLVEALDSTINDLNRIQVD